LKYLNIIRCYGNSNQGLEKIYIKGLFDVNKLTLSLPSTIGNISGKKREVKSNKGSQPRWEKEYIRELM
jgi:hypothetical protein